ncbi:hypothetical protein PJL18_04132 [Paenarthrobacter nicotinovorans]|nr:hypothetical protein [Paenarthrobacter nicotinovorans]
MGIIDAGNNSPSCGVNNPRFRANQPAHIVVAEPCDAAVLDGDGISHAVWLCRVHGVDGGIRDHQISEILHRFSSGHRIRM